jgi:Tfp pilus assembly protein PilN
MDLNLARDPFVNLKPLRRAASLLVLVALFLAALNGYLYWKHFTGQGERRIRSQEVAREIAAEQELIAGLEAELAGMRIEELNLRSDFVNWLIEQRRFPWSRLFDRMTDVLPGAVRLSSLTPRFVVGRNGSRGGRRNSNSDEVTLGLRGSARNGEVLLAFVDNLFAHPAFHSPDLGGENREEGGLIRFSLSAMYLPKVDSSSEEEDWSPEDDTRGPPVEAAVQNRLEEGLTADRPEEVSFETGVTGAGDA